MFVDTLSQLDKCATEIDSSCSFPVDDEAMLALEQCYTDATAYLAKVDNCLNPQFIVQQGCACFAAIQVGDLLDKVIACETKTANDIVRKEKKKCIQSRLMTNHNSTNNKVTIPCLYILQNLLLAKVLRMTPSAWLTPARRR